MGHQTVARQSIPGLVEVLPQRELGELQYRQLYGLLDPEVQPGVCNCAAHRVESCGQVDARSIFRRFRQSRDLQTEGHPQLLDEAVVGRRRPSLVYGEHIFFTAIGGRQRYRDQD